MPVSITEYMTLLEALNKGLIHNMMEFYYVSRSILCKSESIFDVYDVAFANFFQDKNLKFPEEIKKQIWDWLQKGINPFDQNLDLRKYMDILQDYDLEELQRQLEELMREQDKEHNFGNRWIGTQGRSAFGNMGENPMGIRVGGSSGMRMAVKVAQKRLFQDYRKDVVLDTRQIKVALKRLRRLDEIGKQDELDLDKTIDKTTKNGGDIEIMFKKRRKNNVKLLLIMDVGGSMDPYAQMVSILFSAANSMSHWKDFKYYYFHNCVYERVYKNAFMNESESLNFDELLQKYDKNYRVVMVGDAAMASFELTEVGGSIYYYHHNELPGIYYIKQIADHFKGGVVWLNPELIRYDWQPWTRKIISSVIPMYDLTVQGIEEAMDFLRKGGKKKYTTVQRFKDLKF